MKKGKSQLVVADDDATIRRLLTIHGQRAGFEVIAVEDGEEAMAVIDDETEVVLLDLNMPKLDGFGCLEWLAKKFPSLPAVVLSAADEVDLAVRAMKLGAMDYLTKPFDADELMAVLRNARRMSRAERENEGLREAIGGVSGPAVEVVASSEAMKLVISQAHKIASLDSTVLLTGESGVGKGMLARMIHSASHRADKPFVTVSCPAVPRELLESELFGHEKGAFTGAIKRRIGKIEAAAGGTLFLDEIGDLPIDLQPKLLNVLQDREFQRVGGEEFLKADVRIVAATNIDFEEKIKEGGFREDLYYRLSVIPLEIPPLRERLEGLADLSKHLLKKISGRQGRAKTLINEEALAVLECYDWPGNVRQLENVLERAAAFCDEGKIEEKDLPKEVRGTSLDAPEILGIGGISLAELEKQALIQTLQLTGGNKAETARRLGVTEKSVYNKLKRHGLM
ncbi:sigma-54 dependent transcriptional regulator [Verrucomicrobiaceae bacterium 227]